MFYIMFYIIFFLSISLICSTINIMHLIYSLDGTIEIAFGITSLLIFIISILLFSFYNGLKKKTDYIITSLIYWTVLVIGTLFSHLFSFIIFNMFSVTTITPLSIILVDNHVLLSIIIFILVLTVTICTGYYLGYLANPVYYKRKKSKDNTNTTKENDTNLSENISINNNITNLKEFESEEITNDSCNINETTIIDTNIEDNIDDDITKDNTLESNIKENTLENDDSNFDIVESNHNDNSIIDNDIDNYNEDHISIDLNENKDNI